MDVDRVESFFGNLNFELVEIDERETLFFELPDGAYATVTNEDGELPEDLNRPIIWSVYDENDSFQWSVTLEDAAAVEDLFRRFDDIETILDALLDIRNENIANCEG